VQNEPMIIFIFKNYFCENCVVYTYSIQNIFSSVYTAYKHCFKILRRIKPNYFFSSILFKHLINDINNQLLFFDDCYFLTMQEFKLFLGDRL